MAITIICGCVGMAVVAKTLNVNKEFFKRDRSEIASDCALILVIVIYVLFCFYAAQT